jgi:hypothetical protein
MTTELTKECTGCRQLLPLGQFYKKGPDTDRRDCRCRVCRASAVRQYRVDKPEIVKAIQQRTIAKNADKHRARSSKWYQENKEYAKSRMAEHRASNPDQVRDGKLRAAFGITLAEYNSMLTSQDHKCAICGTHEDDLPRRLAVDHCHAAGHVRGLLCGPCNTGLGSFKDSPKFLQTAINYIQNKKQP